MGDFTLPVSSCRNVLVCAECSFCNAEASSGKKCDILGLSCTSFSFTLGRDLTFAAFDAGLLERVRKVLNLYHNNNDNNNNDSNNNNDNSNNDNNNDNSNIIITLIIMITIIMITIMIVIIISHLHVCKTDVPLSSVQASIASGSALVWGVADS